MCEKYAFALAYTASCELSNIRLRCVGLCLVNSVVTSSRCGRAETAATIRYAYIYVRSKPDGYQLSLPHTTGKKLKRYRTQELKTENRWAEEIGPREAVPI